MTYNKHAMRAIEVANSKLVTDGDATEHAQTIRRIIKQYGLTSKVVEALPNGLRKIEVTDTFGQIIAEYHASQSEILP